MILLYFLQEVQESVSNIVDVGLKSGTQAAVVGAAVAQEAPTHFEEKGNFAAGLTKTVEETGGLLSGVIYLLVLTVIVSKNKSIASLVFKQKINLAKVRVGFNRLKRKKKNIQRICIFV